MNVEQVTRMLTILDRDGKRMDEDQRSDDELVAIFENAAQEELNFPRHYSAPGASIEGIACDIFWVYAYLNTPEEFYSAVEKFFENCNHPFPTTYQIKCAAIVEAQYGLRQLIGHIERFCGYYDEYFNVSIVQPRKLLELARHKINALLGPIESTDQLSTLNLPKELDEYLLSAARPSNCLVSII